LGECGLDYFHLPKDAADAARLVDLQKQAFRAQLELALQFDCPLVVHSRNAHDDCVRMIDASGVDWRKVVFHCFTGNAEATAAGERAGRARVVHRSRHLQECRRRARGGHRPGAWALMVETDAPYLTPEPHRKLRNEPAFVRLTALELAAGFEIPLEDLAATATANTREFFGL
jgi:TatD DNase family protein